MNPQQERPGSSAAPGAPKRASARFRLLVATAGIGAVLIIALAVVIFTQPGQSAVSPNADKAPEFALRHVMGDPKAPVTILEWSDFQ